MIKVIVIIFSCLLCIGCGVVSKVSNNEYVEYSKIILQKEVSANFVMAYFTDENSGLRFAVSEDLYNWNILNNDTPYFKPNNCVFRDPYILKTDDRIYHLVYTNNWNSNSFGYVESTDLITWTNNRNINIYGIVSCWAPEIINIDDTYYIYFSMQKTENSPHVIGYITTKDFIKFTDVVILFDQYNAIDANIIYNKNSGLFQIAIKNEDTKQITTYISKSLTENFNNGIIINNVIGEGPSQIFIENDLYVFYDHMNNKNYRLSKIQNCLVYDVSENLVAPKGMRHAHIFKHE